MKYVMIFLKFIKLLIFGSTGVVILILLSDYYFNNIKPSEALHVTPTVKNEISDSPTNNTLNELKIWNLINDWQVAKGWNKYIESKDLCNIVDKRLEETKNDWSQDGFYKHINDIPNFGMAENLGKDFLSEEALFKAWTTSSIQKKNLSDPYEYSCLRCDGNRCIQLFANLSSVNVKGIANSNDNNSDPIVDCNYSHLGTQKRKKSECNISFECQVGSQWYIYLDRNKCTEDQNSYSRNNSYLPPTYSPLPTWAPLPTWNSPTYSPYPTSVYSNYQYIAPTRDPFCDKISSEWDSFRSNFMQNEYNNFESSSDAIFALNNYRQQYQNQANNHGCDVYLSLY